MLFHLYALSKHKGFSISRYTHKECMYEQVICAEMSFFLSPYPANNSVFSNSLQTPHHWTHFPSLLLQAYFLTHYSKHAFLLLSVLCVFNPTLRSHHRDHSRSSDQSSYYSFFLSLAAHYARRMRGRETPKHESLKDVKRKIDHCRCTCRNNSVQWRTRETGTEEEEGDGSIS